MPFIVCFEARDSLPPDVITLGVSEPQFLIESSIIFYHNTISHPRAWKAILSLTVEAILSPSSITNFSWNAVNWNKHSCMTKMTFGVAFCGKLWFLTDQGQVTMGHTHRPSCTVPLLCLFIYIGDKMPLGFSWFCSDRTALHSKSVHRCVLQLCLSGSDTFSLKAIVRGIRQWPVILMKY